MSTICFWINYLPRSSSASRLTSVVFVPISGLMLDATRFLRAIIPDMQGALQVYQCNCRAAGVPSLPEPWTGNPSWPALITPIDVYYYYNCVGLFISTIISSTAMNLAQDSKDRNAVDAQQTTKGSRLRGSVSIMCLTSPRRSQSSTGLVCAGHCKLCS